MRRLPQEAQQLVSLFESGRYRELEDRARALIGQHPDFGFAWKLLGVAVAIQGGESLPLLRRAAELLPDDHEAHNNLGNALRQAGQFEQAALSFRRALELRPTYANAHRNLGDALNAQGRLPEAVASYQRALELNPYLADAVPGLADALKELGLPSEAARCLRRMLELEPNSADAHVQLGQLLDHLGRSDEAVASYERALKLKPSSLAAYSNLLFTRNFLASQTRTSLRQEAKSYGERLAARPFADWPNDPDPARRLRVGLVSGDLYSHPVGYLLEGPVSALDRTRIELFTYCTGDRRDALTRRLEALIPHWRSVAGMSDERLAQQIRDDGIDILIDLAGHTLHHRLEVFGRKPAPVQVTWLGYFGSTGVPGMDYVLADPWSVPEGEEDQFSEEVWRLPETRFCFAPPDAAAEVGPLPALASGHLTYGCFGNLAKAGNAVFAAWAKVLKAAPNAKMFVKAKQLGDRAVRERVLARFREHGIGEDRLIVEGPSPRAAYLAAYSRVDLALDTFPYPGGTTTLEALWMGVPIVTLRGDRMLSRQGESILMNAGLGDWIAADAEDYVRLVLAKSAPPALADLRVNLRARLRSSPLMDAARFAAHLETALREMWARWCSGQPRS